MYYKGGRTRNDNPGELNEEKQSLLYPGQT